MCPERVCQGSPGTCRSKRVPTCKRHGSPGKYGGYFESVHCKVPRWGFWYTPMMIRHVTMPVHEFPNTFLGEQLPLFRVARTFLVDWNKFNMNGNSIPPVKFKSDDTALHAILTNASFNLPSVLPDGNYTSLTF